MINPRRKNNHILLDKTDTDPLVLLPTHIEVSLPVEDVPNLLVLVQMLREERLDLLLVYGAHRRRRDTDLVAVTVSALRGDGVHICDRRAVLVQHA